MCDHSRTWWMRSGWDCTGGAALWQSVMAGCVVRGQGRGAVCVCSLWQKQCQGRDTGSCRFGVTCPLDALALASLMQADAPHNEWIPMCTSRHEWMWLTCGVLLVCAVSFVWWFVPAAVYSPSNAPHPSVTLGVLQVSKHQYKQLAC